MTDDSTSAKKAVSPRQKKIRKGAKALAQDSGYEWKTMDPEQRKTLKGQVRTELKSKPQSRQTGE